MMTIFLNNFSERVVKLSGTPALRQARRAAQVFHFTAVLMIFELLGNS
jgi:hypothetical protein